ncbi:hypothetical protein [Geotalea toluenoxydans]|uniref:hypothetical protein n=1 Tax=Geotalea toluenoxydans TaxID=421624 RepID=UPI0006D279F9|nr:hypothetical protein [Geotalea toluenoxydans]
MKANELINNLSKLGLPMFEPSEEVNVKETLAEVVKSHDVRLWETFPVLLANASEIADVDFKAILDLLPDKQSKINLKYLLIMSWALYSLYNLKFPWYNKYKSYISNDDKSQIKTWKNYIAHDDVISWNDNKINPVRLKKSFDLYFKQELATTKSQIQRHEDFSLAYSLSQLFSPKQIDILNKKSKGLPLSKTEQEYYSRSIKKKVVALANSELHTLAKKILHQ